MLKQVLNYKTINVPKNLSSVSTLNLSEEVEPELAGMTRAGIDALWSGVEAYYKTGVHPGIALCIRRKGKIILKRAIGHVDCGPGDDSQDTPLLSPDTPICQFSASKAVTAMLVHALVENGQIHLKDPVSHYIPEFGANGKENITIEHVLSHRSGFPSVPNDIETKVLFDFNEVVRLICESEPKSLPGHTVAYHAITGGFILGELIKRVTGMNIREFLRKTIKYPLGFKYFNYGADGHDIKDIAVNYSTGLPVVFPFSTLFRYSLGRPWNEIVEISNQPQFLEAIIPAGNLIATADEMSQFFQLLLNGGSINGTRIFEPLTVKRALLEAAQIRLDKTMVLLPMRYSAGMMLGSNPVSLFGPFTPQAYGHWGFFNSFSWADPEREIAVSLLNTGKVFLGPHLVQHFKLLHLISKHCLV